MIRNDLDQYLKKYIEGYLLADLKTIHEKVSVSGNGSASLGNLGYLFTIAICSAMEFLGLLLREDSPVKEGKINASNAMSHYVKHYLEPIDSRYAAFRAVGTQLIRNGISHTYATKGNIAITRKGGRATTHLIKYGKDGVFVLNPDCLYEDFLLSYEKLKQFIASDEEFRVKINVHYEAIRGVYTEEVNRTVQGLDGIEWIDKDDGYVTSVDIIDYLEREGVPYETS